MTLNTGGYVYVDDTATLPIIRWQNGTPYESRLKDPAQRLAQVKELSTPGGFYAKDDELAQPPGDPWQEDDRFAPEIGYSTPLLHIAWIGHRSQAYMVDESGPFKRKIWMPQWEAGMRIMTEILCFAQGIDGPVIWSISRGGMTGAAATKRKTGIFDLYTKGLLQAGSRFNGAKLPPWAFWLPISTKLNPDGSIAFDQAPGYKSVATPPALHLPDLSQATIESFFVGPDLLREGDAIRTEYDGWLKAKRGNTEDAPPVAVGATYADPHEEEEDDDGAIPF